MQMLSDKPAYEPAPYPAPTRSVIVPVAREPGEGFAFFRWINYQRAESEYFRAHDAGWGCFACRANWERLQIYGANSSRCARVRVPRGN